MRVLGVILGRAFKRFLEHLNGARETWEEVSGAHAKGLQRAPRGGLVWARTLRLEQPEQKKKALGTPHASHPQWGKRDKGSNQFSRPPSWLTCHVPPHAKCMHLTS